MSYMLLDYFTCFQRLCRFVKLYCIKIAFAAYTEFAAYEGIFLVVHYTFKCTLRDVGMSDEDENISSEEEEEVVPVVTQPKKGKKKKKVVEDASDEEEAETVQEDDSKAVSTQQSKKGKKSKKKRGLDDDWYVSNWDFYTLGLNI